MKNLTPPGGRVAVTHRARSGWPRTDRADRVQGVAAGAPRCAARRFLWRVPPRWRAWLRAVVSAAACQADRRPAAVIDDVLETVIGRIHATIGRDGPAASEEERRLTSIRFVISFHRAEALELADEYLRAVRERR